MLHILYSAHSSTVIPFWPTLAWALVTDVSECHLIFIVSVICSHWHNHKPKIPEEDAAYLKWLSCTLQDELCLGDKRTSSFFHPPAQTYYILSKHICTMTKWPRISQYLKRSVYSSLKCSSMKNTTTLKLHQRWGRMITVATKTHAQAQTLPATPCQHLAPLTTPFHLHPQAPFSCCARNNSVCNYTQLSSRCT